MQVWFRDSAPNQPTTENPAMFTPNPTLSLPCVTVLHETLSLVYWGGSRKNAGLVSEFRGEPHSELRGCRSSPRQIYT